MHLIRNRWYAILRSSELRAGAPLGRRRLGVDLVFWRDAEGRPVAAEDRCPHRHAKLSPGKVKGGAIECPFHGFTFDRTGACTSIPAHPERKIPKAMCVPTLPLREAHGLVFAWTGPDPAPGEEEPVPFFDFEGYSWSGSEFEAPVATHYTRAIENQLDFPHLPFVHGNTIGRFLGEAFEVETEVEGDRIRARAKGQEAYLELLGPNLWRLMTGPQWQLLVFVPIDEERMLYYVRAYQRTVRVEPLAWLFGRISRVFNRIVLDQDTPVVETQPVIETRLKGMDEVLVPSDGPIIAYRRWREERRGPFAFGGARERPDTSVSRLLRRVS